MKDWFSSLDAREQKFVTTAAVVVVFAILYLAVWSPLDKNHQQMTSAVDLWQMSVQQIKPLRNRIRQSTAADVSPANLQQPLIVVVDSTLRVRQLNNALKRSQPTGNNIRVEFENVGFDDLVLWLGDLSSQYALQLQSGSFSVSSNELKGRVNAQMTLGR